jgi:signal peptidase I
MKIKKIWKFIWHEDSFLSWIVNVVLAFILVKFLIYPGLGLILQTSYPIVAVVSGSMEHNSLNFNNWWENSKPWYIANGITKEEFKNFKMENGFNKGDIIFLKSGKNIIKGDIIVFKRLKNNGNPIIHRVVKIYQENNKIYYQTKGDNNADSIAEYGEFGISQDMIIGKSMFKIPYLGWFKILATDLIKLF